MIVKFSDYVLEQSISDANVSDIMLEQYSAEYNVNMAIANANIKRFMMEAYSDVYQEADSSKPRRSFREWIGNIWEKIVNAVKTFFTWLGTKWKQFINWITGKNIEAVAKKTEELDKKLSDQEKTALAEEIIKHNRIPTPKWIKFITTKLNSLLTELEEPFKNFCGKIDSGEIFQNNNLKSICKDIENLITGKCQAINSLTDKLIKGVKSGGPMYGAVPTKSNNGKQEVDYAAITKSAGDTIEWSDSWIEIKETIEALNSEDFKNISKEINDMLDGVIKDITKTSDKLKAEAKIKAQETADGRKPVAAIRGPLAKVDYDGDDDQMLVPNYGKASSEEWEEKTGDGGRWFGSKTIKNAKGEDVTNPNAALVDVNGPEIKKLTETITTIQKLVTSSVSNFTEAISTIAKACNNVIMNIEYSVKKDMVDITRKYNL